MDNTEIHYLTYDPDAIMTEMMEAYINAGGDTLYAGDEKQMLLCAVQSVITQAFAGVDNALRMSTLRYAVRDYLDIYGENRGCPRIAAKEAEAVVRIETDASGTGVIPAGTVLTEDGSVMYALTEDITVSGIAQTLTARVKCTQAGSVGNGLIAGAQMQFLVPAGGVSAVFCSASATGGQDREEDEDYRERIRTKGLSSVTTGPARQYEAAAKAVSGEVVDAKAVNLGAGSVGVYIIPRSDIGVQALLDSITEALSAKDTRPLTDSVTVAEAEALDYTLNVQYSSDLSASAQSAINDAASEYQTWQESVIGRAFNPEKLSAMLYQAGATRVVFASGSTFNGGSAVYTEIDDDEYCKGTITLAVTA